MPSKTQRHAVRGCQGIQVNLRKVLGDRPWKGCFRSRRGGYEERGEVKQKAAAFEPHRGDLDQKKIKGVVPN